MIGAILAALTLAAIVCVPLAAVWHSAKMNHGPSPRQ